MLSVIQLNTENENVQIQTHPSFFFHKEIFLNDFHIFHFEFGFWISQQIIYHFYVYTKYIIFGVFLNFFFWKNNNNYAKNSFLFLFWYFLILCFMYAKWYNRPLYDCVLGIWDKQIILAISYSIIQGITMSWWNVFV